MREIWSMQPRFETRAGRRPFALLEHPRFHAAYDFLVLRAQSGEQPAELAAWWERFQRAERGERNFMLQPDTGPRKRRRRRRPGGAAASAVPPGGQ